MIKERLRENSSRPTESKSVKWSTTWITLTRVQRKFIVIHFKSLVFLTSHVNPRHLLVLIIVSIENHSFSSYLFSFMCPVLCVSSPSTWVFPDFLYASGKVRHMIDRTIASSYVSRNLLCLRPVQLSIFPWNNNFSILYLLYLIRCPKYSLFLLFNVISNSLSAQIRRSISSLVTYSVQ